MRIINEYKKAGYKLMITDGNLTKDQIDILKSWTVGKFSVITGQSGVGKSTLLNSVDNKPQEVFVLYSNLFNYTMC